MKEVDLADEPPEPAPRVGLEEVSGASASGGEAPAAGMDIRLERLQLEVNARFERLEEGLVRRQREIAGRFDRLEERGFVRDTGFKADLDRFEARLQAVHAAVVDTLGHLANQSAVRPESGRTANRSGSPASDETK